jgi:hypothetical protein
MAKLSEIKLEIVSKFARADNAEVKLLLKNGASGL